MEENMEKGLEIRGKSAESSILESGEEVIVMVPKRLTREAIELMGFQSRSGCQEND
jgi:hypothetical protein